MGDQLEVVSAERDHLNLTNISMVWERGAARRDVLILYACLAELVSHSQAPRVSPGKLVDAFHE